MPQLARALYELANTHPYQTAQADDDDEEEEDDDEEEEDDEEDEEEENGARVRSNSLLAVAGNDTLPCISKTHLSPKSFIIIKNPNLPPPT